MEINESVKQEDFYNQDLEQMQSATNYLAWQKKLILPHVRGKVIEIGAGIGSFTSAWASVADEVLAVEPNQFCFEKLTKALNGNAKVRALQLFAEHLSTQLRVEPIFDTLVSTNVFEHIPDDRAVLMSLIPYLKPGAKIVLQVPSCQWAFGEIDTRLGHYRRYNRRMARKLFEGIEGRFLHLRYYNTIGVLGWWFNARLRRAAAQSGFQIFIFDKLLFPIQSFFERFVKLPFGQCLFIVFEYKPR
jgi:2-polyprenyl-3-methyl-5-hydroxy-6-metoxy-1,4-benzoquinol methylase